MTAFSGKRSGWTAYLLFVVLFITYLLNTDRLYHAFGKCYVVKRPRDLSLRPKEEFKYSHFESPSLVNNPFVKGVEFKALFWGAPFATGNPPLRAFLRSADSIYEVIENPSVFLAPKTQTPVTLLRVHGRTGKRHLPAVGTVCL